jgi:hypothetical protein
MKSSIPIWKCSWCARRKGKLTEIEIKLLESWVQQFGWTLESLVFQENGKVYASCQLPALWKAASGLRREDSLVPAMLAGDTAFNGDALPGKGKRPVARHGSDVAVETSVEPD